MWNVQCLLADLLAYLRLASDRQANAPKPGLTSIVLVLAIVSLQAQAAIIAVDGTASNCQQSSTDELDCDFRSLSDENLLAVAASMEGLTLPSPAVLPYPLARDSTAVLLIVDVSEPAAYTQTVSVAKQLINEARSYHRLGMVSFSGQIGMSLPIGSKAQEMIQAANELTNAQLRLTRNRDLQLAFKSLATITASRRAVVFVTPGTLESQAYYSSELMTTLHAAGIAVYVVVSNLPEASTPGLEALQQLSHESGGMMVNLSGEIDERNTSVGPSGQIPSALAQRMFNHLDSGSRFMVDLKSALRTNIGGARQVSLSLSLPARTITFMVPVSLDTGITLGRQATELNQEFPQAPSQSSETHQTNGSSLVLILALFGLAGAAVKLAWPTVPKPMKSRIQSRNETEASGRPAYLVRTDGTDQQHVIGHTPWRIGRGRSNDLVIDHNSVSRDHAEIIRRADESFMIRDLKSLNGCFINDKKIDIATLSEGNYVDIGDIRFQFSMTPTIVTIETD